MFRLYIFLLALISLFVACNSKPQTVASKMAPETEKEIVRQIAIDTPKTDAIKTPKPKIVVDTIDSLKAEKKKK